MSIRTCAISVVLCVAVPIGGVTAARAGEKLSCEGPLGPKATHESVKAAFGAANVRLEKIDGPEGETFETTVIYPDDPTRRLELIWTDDAKRRGLSDVRMGPKATWVAPNGLAIGSTLAEVEAANGRPFVLSGFEWDYGGTVTDWKGGALDKPAPGGCMVSVTLAPGPKPPGKALRAVSGDFAFPSSKAEMKAVAPTVSRLSFGWPQ